MLTETAPTEAELQTEKRKQLSLLQAEHDYPMAAARDLVRAALYPGHPYGGKNFGTVESIESITLKDIATYQATRLLTQELIFTVTGPTSPDDWRDTRRRRPSARSRRAMRSLAKSSRHSRR